MKIALITNGRMRIPGKNMGSIENIVWNYKTYLEKQNHQVDIYNQMWIQETMYELNNKKYDFVHLHYELFVLDMNKHLQNKNYCLTCHAGAFSKFIPGNFDSFGAFNYSYQDSLEAPGNLVLSEPIKKIYEKSGYKGFLRALRNPVETNKFNFKSEGNGKAIVIGKIQPRKRQAWLAELLKDKVKIDFVGPIDEYTGDMIKDNNTCKYIGSWDKETLYRNLTDYSTLVLLSRSEADPLVVKEALAAGLSVVINEVSSANLKEAPFIRVLSDDEENGDVIASAIQQSIQENNSFRENAQSYAHDYFSYEVVGKEYLQYIEEFKNHNL